MPVKYVDDEPAAFLYDADMTNGCSGNVPAETGPCTFVAMAVSP
jgi:hypothetical protein